MQFAKVHLRKIFKNMLAKEGSSDDMTRKLRSKDWKENLWCKRLGESVDNFWVRDCFLLRNIGSIGNIGKYWAWEKMVYIS